MIWKDKKLGPNIRCHFQEWHKVHLSKFTKSIFPIIQGHVYNTMTANKMFTFQIVMKTLD